MLRLAHAVDKQHMSCSLTFRNISLAASALTLPLGSGGVARYEQDDVNSEHHRLTVTLPVLILAILYLKLNFSNILLVSAVISLE
jgi:hypothetical protein